MTKPMLVVAVTTLGKRNQGSFGPEGRLTKTEQAQIVADIGHKKYSLPASNRWICIDGRFSFKELHRVNTGEEHEADCQIVGSLPTTDTAVAYMDDPATHQPVSVMYAHLTREAIADGAEIVMHGDSTKGQAGCAGNALLSKILKFAVENADILVPLTWDACRSMGLSKWITEDDVMQSINNAHAAVYNNSLWDAGPEERVTIAMANGATYEELVGDHEEVIDREDWTDRAFAKALFVLDHSDAEKTVSAFSTSIGKYKVEAFRRAKLHDRSEREAALRVMRAMLFNRSARKLLTTEKTEVGIIDYATE